jgi:hypothetical protein
LIPFFRPREGEEVEEDVDDVEATLPPVPHPSQKVLCPSFSLPPSTHTHIYIYILYAQVLE